MFSDFTHTLYACIQKIDFTLKYKYMVFHAIWINIDLYKYKTYYIGDRFIFVK